MASWSVIFQSITEAFVAQGVKGVCALVPGGPAIEFLINVSKDSLDRIRKSHRDEADRKKVFDSLLQVGTAEAKQVAAQIVQATIAAQPPELQLQLQPYAQPLADYIAQVPSTARRTCERPKDPSGRTVPDHLRLDDPNQFQAMLPQRPPRFKPGEPLVHSRNIELVELVGMGGFGEVWKAKHRVLPKLYAVKFCLDSKAADSLLRETELTIQVMQSARHPGILTPEDTFLDVEPRCVVYPYIAGGDLTGLVAQLAGLAPAVRLSQANALMRRLAGIVGRAHRLERPVVHRDLKPANILVQKDPASSKIELWVTDFGIGGLVAKQTIDQAATRTRNVSQRLSETFRGGYTENYAPREQREGRPPDPRDDVYALGVIWYQLVVGDVSREVNSEVYDDLSEAGVGADQLAVFRRCLSKAERRFVDAAELADAMSAFTAAKKTETPAAKVTAEVAPPKKEAVPPPLPVAEIPVVEAVAVDEETVRDYEQFQAALLRMASESWLEDRVGSRLRAWRAAADDGLPEGQCLLAECAENGIGMRKDYELACKLYRAAANAGCGPAMNGLGWMYQNGWGVAKDINRALDCYRRAADAGVAAGQHNLACLYRDGQGVRQDATRAVELFQRAADAGAIVSTSCLGDMYLHGYGVPQDYAQAATYYRHAADNGFAYAAGSLGLLYLNGLGLQQDDRHALPLLRRAAETGQAMFQYALGLMCEQGRGTTMDARQAAFWYEKGAQQNDADCCNALGNLYLQGKGVMVDYRRARELFRQAADQNHPGAQCSLAAMYLLGQGVPKDPRRAAEWLEPAVRQGNADAEYYLGLLYANGNGVPHNPQRALQLIQSAASKGHPNAQQQLQQYQAAQMQNWGNLFGGGGGW